MMQNLVVKPTTEQPQLSLNMPGIDELFPGFTLGDFALLYGSTSVIPLTSLLCVRAQLPVQLGGLGSNVIFIDAGNTFKLYKIAHLAQLHQLNPQQTLEHIFISRAFTAYQLTSLIMDRLEEAVKTHNAKLVIISDIAGFYLDDGVANEEALKVYSQITIFLSNFAKKHHMTVIATYLPYYSNRRNRQLQEITHNRADTVLSYTKTAYARIVSLEKHSKFALGHVELPSGNLTLTDFMGA